LRRPDRASAAFAAIADQTEAAAGALSRFGQESDEAFTALARGTGELNRRYGNLRERAHALDLLLRGEDEDQALSAAYLLYKNALDLAHSSVGIAIAEQEQMHQLGQALRRVCGYRDSFQRNHLMLRILAMTMRMEAAGLPAAEQSTFVTIAAAVSEIDEKIVLSTEAAFTRIETIIGESTANLTQSTTLEQSLHRCAEESVGRIQTELDSLKAALSPCAEQSREIIQLIAQTAPQTMAVIQSLQHQDIVRQQLDHVAAGFHDLRTHLQQPDRSAGDAAYVHRAACVQRAHLRGSRVEIERAIASVCAGLQALLETSVPLASCFEALESGATQTFAQSRLAGIFSHEIHQLVDIADRSESANDNSARLVERIEALVDVFSKEIGSHELDVKIVALNAQIASAHTVAAESLNRIAQETVLVADNNAAVTTQLTDELRLCLQSLQGIKSSSAAFLEIASRERSELQTSVSRVSEKLHRLSSRVQSEVASVSAEIREVRAETEQLLAGMRLSELVESCYAPGEALCETILAATDDHRGAGALDAETQRRLERHRSRYTMVKENAAHAAALGAAAPATPATGEPELFVSSTVGPTLSAAPTVTRTIDARATDRKSPSEKPIAAAPPTLVAAPSTQPADAGFGAGIELF
jgi:hypothetical protein